MVLAENTMAAKKQIAAWFSLESIKYPNGRGFCYISGSSL
jgi:hypothetical protein